MILRRLSIKLLYDLKEARERLRNSSRPTSSDLPLDKTGNDPDSDEDKPLPQQDESVGADDYYSLYDEKAAKTDTEKKPLDEADVYTAFEGVDIEWANPSQLGLRLTNTKHTYYEMPCRCGHRTGKHHAPLDTNYHSCPNGAWSEGKTLLWLWVFCSHNVVVCWIASRGSELLVNVLDSAFKGWPMSDGWHAYRYYLKRLRCWAHYCARPRA